MAEIDSGASAALALLNRGNTQGNSTTPMDAGGGGALPQNAPINVEALLKSVMGGEPLLTPHPTMGQPSMPPRMQAPQIVQGQPTGGFSSSGERKRADSQALFQNIGSVVKSAVDYTNQKKERAMAMNTERLMSAMDGVNEAKTSGNKEMLEHNMNIVNSMLDPTTPEGKKNVKDFEKVFNVNLMGEHKDKESTEYKGFMSAFAKYKAAQAQKQQGAVNPIAERLMAAQPQRQGLNPQLAALMEATKAGVVPSADAMVKAQTEDRKTQADIFKTVQDNRSKGLTNLTRLEIAKNIVNIQDKKMQMQALTEVMRYYGRGEVAKVVASANRYRTDKQFETAKERNKILADKVKTEGTGKSQQNIAKMFNDSVETLVKEKDEVDKRIEKAGEGWFTDTDLEKRSKELQKKIDATRRAQDVVLGQYGVNTKLLDEMQRDELLRDPGEGDLKDDDMQEMIQLMQELN